MDKVLWSKEEITEFDKLVDMQSSSDQCTRIKGRLNMKDFINVHSKEKCDAMFEHLEDGGKLEGSK